MKVTTLKVEIAEDTGDWDEAYTGYSMEERWKIYLQSVFEDEPVVIKSVELVSEGDV